MRELGDLSGSVSKKINQTGIGMICFFKTHINIFRRNLDTANIFGQYKSEQFNPLDKSRHFPEMSMGVSIVHLCCIPILKCGSDSA